MKIRSGFVSNSSSASYMVTISESFNSIADKYFSDIAMLLNKDIKSYKRDKKHYEDIIEKLNQGDKTIWYNKEHCEECIKLLEVIIEFLKHQFDTDHIIDKENVLENILQYHSIDIIKKSSFTQFKYLTSMHNDYGSSMDNLLKEIILIYTFENPSNIICNVEHHG